MVNVLANSYTSSRTCSGFLIVKEPLKVKQAKQQNNTFYVCIHLIPNELSILWPPNRIAPAHLVIKWCLWGGAVSEQTMSWNHLNGRCCKSRTVQRFWCPRKLLFILLVMKCCSASGSHYYGKVGHTQSKPCSEPWLYPICQGTGLKLHVQTFETPCCKTSFAAVKVQQLAPWFTDADPSTVFQARLPLLLQRRWYDSMSALCAGDVNRYESVYSTQ